MVNYQTIAELVSQIPVDRWNVLLEIKRRRPVMMLSDAFVLTGWPLTAATNSSRSRE